MRDVSLFCPNTTAFLEIFVTITMHLSLIGLVLIMAHQLNDGLNK